MDWADDAGKGAKGKTFSQKFMNIVMNDPNEPKWLEYVGVSGLDLENTNIETKEDVIALKRGLRIRFPLFMTNIVKILLFRGEEKLACLLTAYFELALDMEMFKCAVENRFFEWLQYVFVFRKNHVGLKNGPGARRSNKTKLVSLLDLFKIVKSTYKVLSVQQEILKIICEWMINGTDNNILRKT